MQNRICFSTEVVQVVYFLRQGTKFAHYGASKLKSGCSIFHGSDGTGCQHFDTPRTVTQSGSERSEVMMVRTPFSQHGKFPLFYGIAAWPLLTGNFAYFGHLSSQIPVEIQRSASQCRSQTHSRKLHSAPRT